MPANLPRPAVGLVWDAMVKEIAPKDKETDIPFSYAVTNRGTNRITIERVETSCGCTVADLPSEPWVLEPGQGGLLKGEFDARNKNGTLTKTLTVFSSAGPQVLRLTVKLPEMQAGKMRDGAERVTNLMEASKNRQAVFAGKCVACHVTPTIGKQGKDLYMAACGICHDAEHRASMVTDLKTLKYGTPRAYWEHWVRNGKPNSLMPAFEQKQGGPLNNEQIKSLVDFLSESKDFPSNVTLPISNGVPNSE
ncbi:MAG TPA: DUF1573 domain-containing protein [Verrucomicrobiae bacterium]